MARQKEEAEWIQAGDNGDSVSLKALIAKKSAKPDVPKAQESLVAASTKGHMSAMRVLLEWGTPADSKDQVGKPALHSACEAGFPEAVSLLIDFGVNLNSLDYNGCTAFVLAVRNKMMPCCKALLKGGASLPPGETAPGLAAMVREVKLERLSAELIASEKLPTVTNEEVNAADPRVWECQSEHMRLLRIREEQRAGSALQNFEHRTALELEEAHRSEKDAAQLGSFIKEKRVELQNLRSTLVLLNRDVSTEQGEEQRLEAEDAQLRAEIQARMDVLSGVESEVEASKDAFPGEELRIASSEDRWHLLEKEIAEQRAYNAMEQDELEAASKEFERWQLDRQAAARLTAQAHKLLGN